MCIPFSSYPFNRGEAISVVRVVVVDVTSRVLIPSIVRVVAVRATQAHILRSAYTLTIKAGQERFFSASA